jgi:hypothetical protein
LALRRVHGWGRAREVEATGVAGAAFVAVPGDVVGVDLEQARKLPSHARTNARNEKLK